MAPGEPYRENRTKEDGSLVYITAASYTTSPDLPFTITDSNWGPLKSKPKPDKKKKVPFWKNLPKFQKRANKRFGDDKERKFS